MSVGKTSDDGNVSIFTDKKVQVYKEAYFLITCRGKPILIGKWDERGLYHIPLRQTRGPCQPPTPTNKSKKFLQEANSVYDLPTTEEAIRWMYAVCRYPVKSTWVKEIQSGNFTGWPITNKRNVAKYYPETTKTPKGYLNQTRKMGGRPSPSQTLLNKQTHQHCELRKYATSTLKYMTYATHYFRTRPGSSPPDPNEATSTSW